MLSVSAFLFIKRIMLLAAVRPPHSYAPYGPMIANRVLQASIAVAIWLARRLDSIFEFFFDLDMSSFFQLLV